MLEDSGENQMRNGNKIIIKAGKTEERYWKDIWQYRELFYFLSWRDILVRYKQTVVGIAWSVIRPLLTMIVLTIVFGKLAHLPSNGVPYPLLVFSAMLPWQFFSNALSTASGSIVVNANLISKIYFPRLIIPTSSIVTSFVDFLISGIILAVFMIWYQFVPQWNLLSLPVFIVMALASVMGISLWITALNVKYRDFFHIIPFIVQFGLYISPVGFVSSIVPDKWRLLYSINPMVGVIDGFRWALLGRNNVIYWPGMLLSAAVACILCVTGIIYFRKTEKTFADII
jgi:lipopolysaccharide transport system permease protein